MGQRMQLLHVNFDQSSEPDMCWMPYGEDFQVYSENFKEIGKNWWSNNGWR
ncbi:MAG TPA: hypothetical protein VKK79_20355 [Candidatus Lokiarchaeia archaeon]|nr:hypothetical protein [Candidatus Lokiarchaeia archaeon]